MWERWNVREVCLLLIEWSGLDRDERFVFDSVPVVFMWTPNRMMSELYVCDRDRDVMPLRLFQ